MVPVISLAHRFLTERGILKQSIWISSRVKKHFAWNHCYCHFPLETCRGSLYLNDVQCPELCFYVRGSRYPNIFCFYVGGS